MSLPFTPPNGGACSTCCAACPSETSTIELTVSGVEWCDCTYNGTDLLDKYSGGINGTFTLAFSGGYWQTTIPGAITATSYTESGGTFCGTAGTSQNFDLLIEVACDYNEFSVQMIGSDGSFIFVGYATVGGVAPNLYTSSTSDPTTCSTGPGVTLGGVATKGTASFI